MNQKRYTNPFEIIYGEGADADVAMIKAKLMIAINQHIRATFPSCTQKVISEKIGISQPELSRIKNGSVQSITIDKLIKILLRLEFKVSSNMSARDIKKVSMIQVTLTK